MKFDDIPVPAAHFSSESECLGLNRAYQRVYGESLLSAHQSRLMKLLNESPSQELQELEDGTYLAWFHPDREALVHRDRLVRDATQMARVGAWEYDLRLQEIRWSDEVYLIHELEPDFEPTLESALEFYTEAAREQLSALVEDAIETGQAYDVELPLVTAKGTHKWVRTRGKAEYFEGECVRLSGAIQEVTEERLTRNKLADVLERFSYAQDSAAFGVWDYQPASGSLHWDEAMFPLYDVDPQGFTGRFEDWSNCVLPEDLPGAVEKLTTSMQGSSKFDTEFRIIVRDGSIRWIKATAHISRNESGQAIRVVGFNYDITSIKRVEEELRESYAKLEQTNLRLEELAASSDAANKAKSDFLANMSHEIRTPMNGVVGMTSLLLESDLTPQQRDSVDIIRKSADALLQLINDLLDFSKVEAGAVSLEEEVTDLRAAVDDLVELLAIEAQSKGLLCSYLVDSNVPALVKIDAGRLRQILINLLGNAVKYTQKGKVSLKVSIQDKELVFEVTDTGPGIEKPDLDNIFSPFSRGTDLGVVGGTGLGLAICHRLTQLMQGELSVESEAARGSKFTLRLPCELVEREPKADWPLDGKRVAITGGIPEVRKALEEALTFLRAKCYDEDPHLELIFAGSEPRFTDCKRVVVLSAAESAQFKSFQQMGFVGPVTYPFRSRPLEETLRDLLLDSPQSCSQSLPDWIPPSGTQVLLVEDNKVNQKVAQRMLTKLGVRHKLAINGKEALRALDKARFDLVLMDLQMPIMDGFEATRALRAQADDSHHSWVPVIALTAHATHEHRARCFDAGMSDFLTKPLRIEDLRKTLKKWLSE